MHESAEIQAALELDTLGHNDEATAKMRDIVAAHAAQTDYLDLDDPGVVADIDDPAAYRELTGASL